MSWVKLDDHFHSHPKVCAASLAAVGLYVRSLSYCGAYETNGAVPYNWALTTAGGKPTLLEELIQVGLWKKTKTGFKIPDFLDYNPSRREMDKKREGTRNRVAKHRKQLPTPQDGNATVTALHER